jgi:uncharacterized membrane protein HdeD (DUF308 family)
MTTLAPSSKPATGNRSRWKWFLGLGVLLVLLGLAGAGATTLLELASVLVFGPMLLASSILQLLMAFFAGPQPVPNQHCQEGSKLEGRRDEPSPTRKWLASWPVPTKESMIHYMDAGLEAVLGFLIMAHPLVVVTDLTVLVAVFLMLRGLVRLIRSSITHSPGRRWILMLGVAALLLGICVWLRLPVSGLWFVGLCVALDFICHGICWAAIGLAEGKPLEESLP